MKQIISLICCSLLLVSHVWAATTPTVSPSQTPQPTEKKNTAIDDLKDRLATKVAELKQLQKKAIAGIVKSVTETTITLETKTNDTKIDLIDSLKIVQTIKGVRTTLTAEDIDKSEFLVVFGDYDAALDLLKPKIAVIQASLPLRIHGTITEIDKKEFTLTVQSALEKTYLIDIEKTTGINQYVPGSGITKGGFSKTAVGDVVHVIGTAVPKEIDRISATRILNLGSLGSPTASASPTPTEIVSTSASGSSKLTVTPVPTK